MEQAWYMSNETYRRILDVMASACYGNEAEMAAKVRKEFGLNPYVIYRIIVETEQERCRRSLKEMGLWDYSGKL